MIVSKDRAEFLVTYGHTDTAKETYNSHSNLIVIFKRIKSLAHHQAPAQHHLLVRQSSIRRIRLAAETESPTTKPSGHLRSAS
jgi:hypothetical protein